jgi:hypothetical protein
VYSSLLFWGWSLLVVQSVEIRGTGRPLDLQTRPGRPLDAGEVRRDVRRLWETGWFDDIRVETAGTPAGVIVTFHVVERPRVYLRRVRIEPRSERRDLHVEPATLFPRHRAQQAANLLREQLAAEGYRAARVEAAIVPAGALQADLVLRVDRGPRTKPDRPAAARDLGLTPHQRKELCRCLLAARREAEAQGRLDFQARVVLPNLEPVIERGPVYRVGRIDFRGHHSSGDATLRRLMRLDEGDVFDLARLRESVARLNRLGLFEPAGSADVTIRRHPDLLQADVIIGLREAPRGRWSLSGPLGPASIAGPLQAKIAARLPGWGNGVLAASTYYLGLSLSGFTHPLWYWLGWDSRLRLMPVVALERPVVPGQEWASGFLLSPQLGRRDLLARYTLTQFHRGVRAATGADSTPAEDLVVSDALTCKEPRSLWSRLAAWL